MKVRDQNGNEVWLSHLDGADVKVGDKIGAGQRVGAGGNSGNTIPMGGGDGSHLDITIKRQNQGFMSAPEVQKYVQDSYSAQRQETPQNAFSAGKIPDLPSIFTIAQGLTKLPPIIQQLLQSGNTSRTTSPTHSSILDVDDDPYGDLF